MHPHKAERIIWVKSKMKIDFHSLENLANKDWNVDKQEELKIDES